MANDDWNEDLTELDITAITLMEDGVSQMDSGALVRRKFDQAELRIVVFRLAGNEYVMNLSQVLEIFRPTNIKQMAGTPSYIEGFINRYGRNIPIVDLSKRLGFSKSPPTPETCVITTFLSVGVVGFLVDSATELLSLRTNLFEVPTPVFTSNKQRYLQGVAHLGERLLVMLDLENLFMPYEQQQLRTINLVDSSQFGDHSSAMTISGGNSRELLIKGSNYWAAKVELRPETLYSDSAIETGELHQELDTAAIRRLVAFELSGELYGVHITDVTEIRESLPRMPLPNVPNYILGLINLRGTVLPVIDLRRKFGLSLDAENPNNRLVVLKGVGYQVALLVDAVHGLARLPKSSFQPPPAGMVQIHPEYYEQVAIVGGRMLTELNVQKLLADTAVKAQGEP